MALVLRTFHTLILVLGSPDGSCLNPLVSCTAGTLFPSTCYLNCPNGYVLTGMSGGVKSVSCQTNGRWPTVRGYCVRANKAPTDVSLFLSFSNFDGCVL